MGKKDKAAAAEEAKPAEAAAPAAEAAKEPEKGDAKADDKKDGEVKPEDVPQAVDEKKFDGFLSGKKPNGKSRRCTDCLCLLLVMAMWALTTHFGLIALQEGSMQKLIGGLDYDQRICGYSSQVADKFNWNIVSWNGAGKCLYECPLESTWNQVNWFSKKDIPLLICKDEINATAWWKDYPFFLIYYGECMFQFASTDYVGFCVLDDMSIFSAIFEQYFEFDDGYNLDAVFESTNFITTICGDIWNARNYILMFGFGGSMVCAYAYTYAMRIAIITKTVVWGSIWSVFFAALALAGYAHYMVGVYQAAVPMVTTPEDITTLETLSMGFFIGAMSWLCVILFLKDRLTLAIGLIIQTAKALVSMPIIVIVIPLIQIIAFMLFIIPWMVYCVMLAASGNIVVDTMGVTDDDAAVQITYKSIEYSKYQKKQAWFMLFSYFWTCEFIIAAGQMITSMCLCCFYFTRDKTKIGNSTVLTGLWLVIRYHLGTIAFGSCLIAIVRMIEAYITYLEKYGGGGETKLKKLVLRCLKCFMACIERCIKYINFNAYVQTCIYGTTFCTSAFNAFWLIFRNIARIAAVTGVTAFLGLIGKIAVVMGTASSFYYVMGNYYADLVTSLTVPTALVAVLATFVAIMFFEVFGMGTAVLLQCFVCDEELFKENPEECFADGDLKKYLNKNGKSRKKKAPEKTPEEKK